MSLSCSGSNSHCVPSVHLVNVNSQLCPDPAANVAIMDTVRIYNANGPWIGMYGQTAATKALGTTGALPATVRQGAHGHSTVQSQRVVSTPVGASSLVSNMGFSSAPAVGTYVQSLSAEAFTTPETATRSTAPIGSTGYSVSAQAAPSKATPSYGLIPLHNRAASYGSIMASPIPLPTRKNA